MPIADLFQWGQLQQDVPNSSVQAGDRAVVVDHLPATPNQPEPGYLLEAFRDGETLDVVAVPMSWVMLPEIWGKPDSSSDKTDAKAS